MAWPLSPLQSFLSGTPPFIEAATLNSVQDAIIRIVSGTYSLKSVYVDGTGGVPILDAFTRPGTVTVNGLITGTTLPTPVQTEDGLIGLGNCLRGWAVVSGAGVLLRGYNVIGSERTPAGAANGDYLLTFQPDLTDGTNICVFASILGNGTPATIDYVPSKVGTHQTVRIGVFNLAGARTDRAVSCGFYGE